LDGQPGFDPCLFANRDGTPTRYSLHLTRNKDQIAFWNGTVVSTATIPAAGTNWHLLALSFDSGNWTVYWDGQTLMTLPQTFSATTGLPTQIGSSSSAATTEGWLGGLDEVSFFSDVLTPRRRRRITWPLPWAILRPFNPSLRAASSSRAVP